MVDKITPLGHIQNVSQSGKKTVETKEVRGDKAFSSPIVDEVVLSEEAIGASQAENTAKLAGKQLAENNQVLLSSDSKRLNSLI